MGRIEHGAAGDNIGMNVKALNKDNMPRVGDVMVYKSDATLATTKNFAAQVQILDIPGEIEWKMGKDTGGEKSEGAVSLKTNDAAEGIFEPQQPMVVDSFDKCEGLSRIAFMDGNSAVMLGKVCGVNCEKTWAK